MPFEHESRVLRRARASINMSARRGGSGRFSNAGGREEPEHLHQREQWNLQTTEKHLNDQAVIKKEDVPPISCVSARCYHGNTRIEIPDRLKNKGWRPVDPGWFLIDGRCWPRFCHLTEFRSGPARMWELREDGQAPHPSEPRVCVCGSRQMLLLDPHCWSD